MLTLMLDSALRSLLLGGVVWMLLKLLRLVDTRTQTAVWTAVLIAALAMPLLRQAMPSLILSLPHLPHLPAAAASRSHSQPFAVPASSLPTVVTSGVAWTWLLRHARSLLLGAYAAGLLVCLMRIAAGLLLTRRIYRSAVPVTEPWAAGRNIRASGRLQSPVSVAWVILLTSDYRQWSVAKRDAVLAHEDSHIARGDFFVQLAALIHCALFWFSPFAWWLHKKLAEIAETASDDAAIQRLNDRITYAEILIDVSRGAQSTPLLVGMAKRHFIDQRVEHILCETPARTASPPLRGGLVAACAALTLMVAGAKAVVTAGASPVPAHGVTPTPTGAAATTASALPTTRRAVRAPGLPPALHGAARSPATFATAAAPPADEVTYNPRALLDARYLPRPDHLPPTTVVHAGKLFYARSTEKPVADVSVAYGLDGEHRHVNQAYAPR